MCGIWGYIGRKVYPSEIYYGAFNNIKHRGPDSSYFKQINDVGFLGFHRLNIRDSYNGDQPFVIKESRSTTFSMCNGEIYNYDKLIENKTLRKMLSSKSDCEVIPYLGTNAYRYIKGEYAYSQVELFDKSVNIRLATDHLGIRPLFYAIDENGFGWSSEIKGLIDIFSGENIHRFPANSYLDLSLDFPLNLKDCEIPTPTCYGDINPVFNSLEVLRDKELVIEKIRDTLTNCVRDMVVSDRPMGCLLSGGLDSSIISAIVASHLRDCGKTLNTFSVGIRGSSDEYYAREVAKFIGSNHTHFEFSQEAFLAAIPEVIWFTETWDITTIRASVGQYLVSKRIKETTPIKVLLVGDGSDELCSGYLYSHNAPDSESLHRDNLRLLKQIHYFDVLRADRGIAGWGLEARVPFLDRRFVDLYLNIDPSLRNPKNWYTDNNIATYSRQKIKGKNIEKALLREAFKDYLPMEVVWRKKEAFSDGVSSQDNSWFRIIQNKANKMPLVNKEYEHCQPFSKESMLYRQYFDNMFPGCERVIPHYWMPQWSGEFREPSARVLDTYD